MSVLKLPSTVAAIENLRPTQMTVGFREAAIKRARLRESGLTRRHLAERKRIPVIYGPQKRPYVIDGHHQLLALHGEGVEEVLISIVEDMSALDSDSFWQLLSKKGWTHPFDAEGRRCAFSDMPNSLTSLINDPFRSLSNELKRRGGYTKCSAPFSQCRWADVLRNKIDRSLIDNDFTGTIKIAMKLVARDEFCFLPGWRPNSIKSETL